MARVLLLRAGYGHHPNLNLNSRPRPRHSGGNASRYDPSTLFVSSCGHDFCRDCNRTKTKSSTHTAAAAKSCPPGIALRILNYLELQAFCERAIVYSAKGRVYCAEPTCSKFVPPFAAHGEHGVCRECLRETHLPCRSLAHPGVNCPMNDALQDVLAMTDGEN